MTWWETHRYLEEDAPRAGLSAAARSDHHQAVVQLGDLVQLENLEERQKTRVSHKGRARAATPGGTSGDPCQRPKVQATEAINRCHRGGVQGAGYRGAGTRLGFGSQRSQTHDKSHDRDMGRP